ncbi:hypothetical protein D0Y65_048220 [Glycine soja]|uniref:DUF7271 domain-containing protein n=1 Tax=Glycine soja TaxID=3848 RepID=A0A445FS28_GLYSO|nr:hypothetical protein D0Y65_048220 [Glycine soja]
MLKNSQTPSYSTTYTFSPTTVSLQHLFSTEHFFSKYSVFIPLRKNTETTWRMASKLSTDSTKTNTSSDSSSATSKDMIEVSSFYHRQWALEYLEFVNFRYDGTTYQIRLRQHRAKVYFAEGLNEFRKDLSIFESVIIKFLACNNKSMFDLYFVPSLECQTCGRPQLMSRQHIWTLEITQSMLGAPGPLRLPNCAMTHVNSCGQHMTILRRFGPPL